MHGALGRYVRLSFSALAVLELTIAMFVGAARDLIPELIERAKKLKVSGGFEEGTDL